ncbi:MAG: pirin family protein [Nocardioidaceae bacterium]|nr:pirin family protein [Nocardioidaceae bacterium]
MSNLEADATETDCPGHDAPGPMIELLESREVPLGGVRGVSVHRTLPSRRFPTVGAWCFVDQFDPGGTTMRVMPHPHTGLQTVTWLFDGRVRHRDTLGTVADIVPGQLNWMTSGAGVAHSEVADETAGGGRGLQLWVALPESARHGAPGFEQLSELPEARRDGMHLTVLAGTVDGVTSPARTFTPLVGAILTLEAGAEVELGVDPDHEHGVQLVDGDASVCGTTVPHRAMAYLGTGRRTVTVHAVAASTLLLLGGEPFAEDVLMWWNFVGRTHDEVVQARADWEAGSDRFGHIEHHGDERIPAPPMPEVRLTPRRRR